MTNRRRMLGSLDNDQTLDISFGRISTFAHVAMYWSALGRQAKETTCFFFVPFDFAKHRKVERFEVVDRRMS